MRIGPPSVVFSYVYVGNVAYAHVCCARALRDANTRGAVGGRSYIIAEGTDRTFWSLIEVSTWQCRAALRWSLWTMRGVGLVLRCVWCNRADACCCTFLCSLDF